MNYHNFKAHTGLAAPGTCNECPLPASDPIHQAGKAECDRLRAQNTALLAACKSSLAMLTSPKFQEWQAKHSASSNDWMIASAMRVRKDELFQAIEAAR